MAMIIVGADAGFGGQVDIWDPFHYVSVTLHVNPRGDTPLQKYVSLLPSRDLSLWVFWQKQHNFWICGDAGGFFGVNTWLVTG